jgi:hypothetical protein
MVIYETINLINGRRYIGKDKFNDPNYIGSGRILLRAIKKYGKDNFRKIILEQCNSEQELNEREKYWIQITNAQKSQKYYNIGTGGEGGDNFTYNPNKEIIRGHMKENRATHTKKPHTQTAKENQKLAAKGRYTLQWFQDRYGLEEGLAKYESRRQSLKNRDYSKFRDLKTGKFGKA